MSNDLLKCTRCNCEVDNLNELNSDYDIYTGEKVCDNCQEEIEQMLIEQEYQLDWEY